NGYTSVYLQYSYVRIRSLIKKAAPIKNSLPKDLAALIIPKENILLIKLAKYPEAVRFAALERDPSSLVKYLFELAQLFNDYYQSVNILQAEPAARTWRLNLLEAVGQTLKNGLELLGLETVEEM
ncbi:MAG: DALR anticodon-binding domain-containing protein, partial [Candidatus Falkowbacteria bacterium]|nr:DALR anticodon-binding domain-containing protein [Candidatus Falkowbacteria bacterium]